MREFLTMKLDKLNKELEELSNKREVLYKEYLSTFSPAVEGQINFIDKEIEFARGQKMAYELVKIEESFYGGASNV